MFTVRTSTVRGRRQRSVQPTATADAKTVASSPTGTLSTVTRPRPGARARFLVLSEETRVGADEPRPAPCQRNSNHG